MTIGNDKTDEYMAGKSPCTRINVNKFELVSADPKNEYVTESTVPITNTINRNIKVCKLSSILFSLKKYPARNPLNVFENIALPRMPPETRSKKKAEYKAQNCPVQLPHF